MRVKRLEIQGFKSFKDKTVIHFDHNITGIVGPNGCGKSNIVDAFFWVMGEQSYKHMRGSSSEDLIFNGSTNYSPLGWAEATLVMEIDGVDSTATATAPAGATVQDIPLPLRTKEVSVTRRLYRSGEGEYFVNGTLARLKDIQELFMDTGVGAKGYSVIEQGQIGKIVNAKPEERRLLIEEAAGIAKYKARKKESLRKMEATQSNLSRLTDIIQEIERSLGSLERQAQKAQQYKKYKDELFDKEITWGRRKNRLIQAKLSELRSRRDLLEEELVALRAEIQIGENSIEVDQIQLVTETKEAEVYQAKIQELSNDLSDQRSSLELSRRRQGDLASQLQSMEEEEDQLNLSIETDLTRLQTLEEQALEAGELFENASQEVADLNEATAKFRKEVEASRMELDSIQRSLMQGMNAVSSLTSQSSGLLSKGEVASAQAKRLAEQEEAQVLRMNEIAAELEKLAHSIEIVGAEKDALREKREEQTSQLREEEENLVRLEKEKNLSLRTLTETRSRFTSLQELDQSHEGLGYGPKAALDWAKTRNKNQNILPFTDLLEVTSGYEAALESWLENRLEHLIVDDPDLALPLLDDLKKGKLGKVGICLLSENSGESDHSSSTHTLDQLRSTLEGQGFQVLGELSQFVKTTRSNAHSLHHLFRNVCVVESAAPIAAFIRDGRIGDLAGWSIVSLDGVALEAQGILRGGSADTSTGGASILRRKKLLEELKERVSVAEEQYAQLEETCFQAKEGLDLLRMQLKSTESEYQRKEIQLTGLERDIHQIERASKEANHSLERTRKDANEMLLQAEHAAKAREEIELKLNALLESRQEFETKKEIAEKLLAQKEELFRNEDELLQVARVREASSRERTHSLKREREAVESVLSDRKRRLAEIKKTFERATMEREQFTGREAELHQRYEELTVTLSLTREKLAAVKDRIEQANAQVNKTLAKVKDLHKKGEQKTSESTQLALDVEKLSGELSHLTLNLEEKYGSGCLQASSSQPMQEEMEDPIVTAEISAEEEQNLSEEVERLRERIRRLGEVNVMAIEEFEQLKKRHDHLLTEKQDLERSMENLKEAIEHINKTSEERFKKAFTSIAERFEKLFPIIFGGGQARLSLIYPEGSTDILEAGVDIEAQPPGKKVSNITLLSGGEKALTAVSLIFAIFMVKPSPFCVLDEVDAPLDDANIGRFNALLREMSSKSQFILITHNKKTMELNDTLYGVTMEEPGVSKMVSIEMH